MKRFFSALNERYYRLVSSIVDFVLHWLTVPFLLAVASGSGVWGLLNLDQLSALAKNRVPSDDRLVMLAFLGGALLVLALVYAGYVALYKWRNHAWPEYRAAFSIHRWLCFLFALPIVSVFMTRRIEHDQPIFVVFLIAAAAVACFPTFVELVGWIERLTEKYRLLQSGRFVGDGLLPRVLRYLPDFIVFIGVVAYIVHFSTLTTNGLQALKTRTADMAIYTNIFFNSSHGDFLDCALMASGNHAAAHFDPILILFSPFYMLYPRPETLVVLETVWFGLGMFPAFWLGKRILENAWAGVAVAAMYGLHPCLHLVNLFEFHSMALIVSPLLLGLYLLEARYYRRFFAFLPIILFIREDMSLLMCFVGLSNIMSNRKAAWVGGLTILVSVSYFILIKHVFMSSPDMFMSGNKSCNYSNYFSYMIPHRDGLRGLVLSIVTNPVYALRQMISVPKLVFVLKLVGPLLFIPFWARRGRFMLLYGAVFLLLASRAAVFNNRYHYQMLALPILIALLPLGIKRIIETEWFGLARGRLMAALLGTLLVSGGLSGAMFGALVKEKTPKRFSFRITSNEEKQFEEVMKMVEMIEPTAFVVATHDIAPYVAGRKKINSLNHYRVAESADYMLINRRIAKSDRLAVLDADVKAGRYETIKTYRNIVLYKYKPPKKRKR